MKRYMLLFLLSAASAFAQFGNTCITFTVNPNTGIDYPDCSSSNNGSPRLTEIDHVGSSNGLQVYNLVAGTLGSQAPSICFGQAEPYDPVTNTFPDPIHGNLSTAQWIYVCRPVYQLSTWNPSTGVIQVGAQDTFSRNDSPGIPASLRAPMVMLTNNDTGKSSIVYYKTAPDNPHAGPSLVTVNQVTSLGIYAGSGLARYQASGYGFSTAFAGAPPSSLVPTVELLTAQFVSLDSLGEVLSRTPASFTASLAANTQYTTVWLPVQQAPQVIDSSATTVIFQTVPLNPLQTVQMPPIAAGGVAMSERPHGSPVLPPLPNPTLLVPTIVRGYLLTNPGRVGAAFNFQP